MKNSMFYTYDNNINTVACTDCSCHDLNHFKALVTDTAVKYLYNSNGEKIGISAPLNSTFPLFFQLDAEDPRELYQKLRENRIIFKVLNFKYEEVSTVPVELIDDLNALVVNINTCEHGINTAGNYRFQLSLLIEDKEEILYAPKECLLKVL